MYNLIIIGVSWFSNWSGCDNWQWNSITYFHQTEMKSIFCPILCLLVHIVICFLYYLLCIVACLDIGWTSSQQHVWFDPKYIWIRASRNNHPVALLESQKRTEIPNTIGHLDELISKTATIRIVFASFREHRFRNIFFVFLHKQKNILFKFWGKIFLLTKKKDIFELKNQIKSCPETMT